MSRFHFPLQKPNWATQDSDASVRIPPSFFTKVVIGLTFCNFSMIVTGVHINFPKGSALSHTKHRLLNKLKRRLYKLCKVGFRKLWQNFSGILPQYSLAGKGIASNALSLPYRVISMKIILLNRLSQIVAFPSRRSPTLRGQFVRPFGWFSSYHLAVGPGSFFMKCRLFLYESDLFHREIQTWTIVTSAPRSYRPAALQQKDTTCEEALWRMLILARSGECNNTVQASDDFKPLCHLVKKLGTTFA